VEANNGQNLNSDSMQLDVNNQIKNSEMFGFNDSVGKFSDTLALI
jgi:hypothetical protein